MEQLDDIDYIKEVLNGKTESFGYLIDRHSRMVQVLVHQTVGQTAEADEIVQDVFIKAFRSLSAFSGKSKFSTWLYRIAYNTAISSCRKKRPRFTEQDQLLGLSDDSDEFTAWDENREQLTEQLIRVIGKLAEQERALIALFYYEESPIEEIAEILGLSIANVKVRLHRTRKKIYILMTENNGK